MDGGAHDVSAVDHSCSQAEFNGMCAEIAKKCPQWELRQKKDLFGRASSYLYSVVPLRCVCTSIDDGACNGSDCHLGSGTELEAENPPGSFCSEDSDADRASCSKRELDQPGKSSAVDESHLIHENSGELLVTYYVSYSECYALPQVHFWFDGSSTKASELTRFMPGVVVGVPEGAESSGCAGFIVSPSFCEELQMALWSVHQCDAVSVLDVCHLFAVQGSLLERFLRAIGTHVGFPPPLIP